MTIKKPEGKRFYRKEDETAFRFFNTPKVLYYNKLHRNLSLPAKTLYCILLDRLELSLKHQWLMKREEFSFSFVPTASMC